MASEVENEVKAEPMLREKHGITRDRIDEYKKERRGLEVDVLDEVLKSRKVAWIVASVGAVLAVVALFLAGFVVQRYSQPIPEHILTINKDTGVVQQVNLLPDQKTSYGEVVDSYWVSQFVIHYESYDFYSAQADYNAVGLMAAPQVSEPYLNQFAGPDAKDKRLGDSLSTRVHVSSVILDRKAGTATIRFSTQDKYRDRPMPELQKEWIAVLAYKYENFPETASQRFINPLGFRVLSFRAQPVAVGGN